jgi:6-phosphogluconolactonase
MDFIISGYGTEKKPTLVLYHYKKDKPVEIKWQDTIESPSFVCQGDGYLFTITEADDYAKVYVYAKDNNGYRLSDQRDIDGGALCHITYSSKNKALFGACYGTGTIFSVRVSEGKFGEPLYYERQSGATPDTLTRAHCVLLNKEENELIVNNIALDKIFFYDISDGCLRHKQEVTLPTGSGPRHAILSSDERFLYIITEYSNEIFVYRNDHEKQLLQKISALAEDYSGISFCSTMCFSKKVSARSEP